MDATTVEARKFETELEQARAVTAKLLNEAIKIQAETTKIQTEIKWYPFIAGAGAGAALLAAAIGLIKLFAS
ncbi:MAG: hypothetical protein LBC91_05130 [Candidatus Accumulibacter sp.]|jgi:hypothetical protein|nr:hypothetical protein [Accumulibacter sp.]